MNSFIVTSKGFVKDSKFNKEKLEVEVFYTDKLRFAQGFNSSTAKSFMEKHKIEGFVYKPWEDEPLRDLYKVVKRNGYSFDEERNGEVLEYVVSKVWDSESDASFLRNKKKIDRTELYSLDEANTKAIELNTKMLEELKKKIKVTKKLIKNK